MRLELIKCDWGMEHLGDQRERLRRYADAGWDGVECAFPEIPPEEFGDLCDELGLRYVAMLFCDDEVGFRLHLDRIKHTRPILINCHGGRDFYEFERGVSFFRAAMEMAGEICAPVVFETHRMRLLYSPWTTARYLEALPDLRITADFSHFTTVAENDLSLPVYAEFLDKAIARADHIHARVGSAHAPQVADPRAGQDFEWTLRFESWWDRIIEQRRREGRAVLTVNPEFGPAPYQPSDPRSGAPMADIWEVGLWMADRFRTRWGAAAHPVNGTHDRDEPQPIDSRRDDS